VTPEIWGGQDGKNPPIIGAMPRSVHNIKTRLGRVAYYCAGEGPLVLCLHGFPDTPDTFFPLMDELADQGYRAVVPYLFGYHPSAPLASYDLKTLAHALLAFADALGNKQILLVGHDWGAVISYAAAALFPQRIDHLICAAIPPPRSLEIALGDPLNVAGILRQLLRSWYIFFFQFPYLPPASLRFRDFALVEWLWRRWSPGWQFDQGDLDPIKSLFRNETTLNAALAYYRSLAHGLFDPVSRRIVRSKISVPTTLIAGAQDGCLGISNYAALDSVFIAPYRMVTLIDAGHFMHREDPQRFNEEVLASFGDAEEYEDA
jgi:pimeloyl-ACP methyl ester carboxylesterase